MWFKRRSELDRLIEEFKKMPEWNEYEKLGIRLKLIFLEYMNLLDDEINEARAEFKVNANNRQNVLSQEIIRIGDRRRILEYDMLLRMNNK